jgi:uncharacterized protein (DUF983 family)
MNIPRRYIFLAIVIVLFALVWSKLRVVLFINLSLWQAVLIFGGTAVVLFLVIDQLINRTRD